MRISNPELKGKWAARALQGLLLVGCIVLYVWGNTSIITVDSSGSPGRYRTGLTEGK